MALVGCGSTSQTSQLEKQAEEIGRLQLQLREADARLDVASKQMAAIGEQAERSTQLLKVVTTERDEIEQKAAEEIEALQEKLTATSERLRLTAERLERFESHQREEAQRLSPVGTWAMGGQESYRFLFFPNGAGVFQHWAPGWKAGDRHSVESESVNGASVMSNGRFVFEDSTVVGTFDMRFTRRGTKFPPPYRRPPFSSITPPQVPAREVEEEIRATVVVKDADTLRIVGWQKSDAVLTRVDEDWEPDEK